jgi:hypothetical protein
MFEVGLLPFIPVGLNITFRNDTLSKTLARKDNLILPDSVLGKDAVSGY